MAQTVIGIFQNKTDVEDVIDELKEEGFQAEDISIVMKESREADDIHENTGADVVGGAVGGATTGAIIGGIAGLLAATVIPGLGVLLIGGPLAAALGLTGAAATTVAGAATGAVAGGLLGALMGLGLSREDAQHYEERVKEGAVLVAVPAMGREVRYIEDLFDDYEATDVKVVGEAEDMPERTHNRPRYHVFAGAKGGRTRSRRRHHRIP